MKDSQRPDHVSLANMISRLREIDTLKATFDAAFEQARPWIHHRPPVS